MVRNSEPFTPSCRVPTTFAPIWRPEIVGRNVAPQAGIGKLIGMRTWGGLVGISGNPGLIDGATVNVPTFGYYESDGTWGIEGHGVDPDIRVVDDPALMVDGGDPQLDAAIRHILEELEKNPYQRPRRPKSPDRSGMGIPDSDK